MSNLRDIDIKDCTCYYTDDIYQSLMKLILRKFY